MTIPEDMSHSHEMNEAMKTFSGREEHLKVQRWCDRAQNFLNSRTQAETARHGATYLLNLIEALEGKAETWYQTRVVEAKAAGQLDVKKHQLDESAQELIDAIRTKFGKESGGLDRLFHLRQRADEKEVDYCERANLVLMQLEVSWDQEHIADQIVSGLLEPLRSRVGSAAGASVRMMWTSPRALGQYLKNLAGQIKKEAPGHSQGHSLYMGEWDQQPPQWFQYNRGRGRGRGRGGWRSRGRGQRSFNNNHNNNQGIQYRQAGRGFGRGGWQGPRMLPMAGAAGQQQSHQQHQWASQQQPQQPQQHPNGGRQ